MEPFTNAVAVTPSDATMISETEALWVGTGGSLTVVMVGGEQATFGSVPSGTRLDISVVKVMATGTTASSIVALR